MLSRVGGICFLIGHGYIAYMREFLGRWVLVATVVLGVLGVELGWGRVGGLGGGLESAVVLAALWVGFVNALVRPAFWEVFGMRFRGVALIGVLLGVLAGVNGFLFGFLGGWEPALAGISRGGRLVAMLLSVGVGGVVSSVFRARDGRWHWITYHGREHEPNASRSVGRFPPGGDG